MKADFPTERWFWFDPPFHPTSIGAAASPGRRRAGASISSSGWDADPEQEKQPERIMPRAARDARCADARFEHRMGQRLHVPVPAHATRFVHGRVLFAGDAAHVRLAVRRARRQQRRARTPTIWLEARARCSTARRPVRLLDTYARRAQRRRRRKHPPLDAHAPISSRPRARRAGSSATRCWARQAPPLRAAPGQQRPPVGAGHAFRLADSTRRTAKRSPRRWHPARPRSTLR